MAADRSTILQVAEPLSALRASMTRMDMRALAVAFHELSSLSETDAVLRSAVELARDSIGVERAAIFLIDPRAHRMVGTWGTDLERRTRDEHHVMYDWGEEGREMFRRAAEEGKPWSLLENLPTTEDVGGKTLVYDRSWVACTPIFSARRPIGMMFNDAGRHGTPVDEERQGLLAVLCAFVGALLDRPGAANELPALPRRTSGLISNVVRELASQPSLSGVTLARRHRVSVSRLARAFKAEMGVSIVEHRNQLRLQRFLQLVDAGQAVLPAALEAGFGSYAQFHRVFRATHQCSPAEYLGRREPRRKALPGS